MGGEECGVLRAKAGVNWGERAGSDMERQTIQTSPHVFFSIHLVCPPHTIHLSARLPSLDARVMAAERQMTAYGHFFLCRLSASVCLPARVTVFEHVQRI